MRACLEVKEAYFFVNLVYLKLASLTRYTVTPFMQQCLRSQCGCITLINRISTEALMWLLLCGSIGVTNALLTYCDGSATA